MLSERCKMKKICYFHLTPLYTRTGWYFKTRAQRHSRGPFLMLQDAKNAAEEKVKSKSHTH